MIFRKLKVLLWDIMCYFSDLVKDKKLIKINLFPYNMLNLYLTKCNHCCLTMLCNYDDFDMIFFVFA